MKIRSVLTAACFFLGSTSFAMKMETETEQPMDDAMLGMMGMQQAAKDPEMLAQLMKDLMDPELMAEAKKMMDNPKFQADMKKMTKDTQYKAKLKEVENAMKDPNQAAKVQAQMEHMVKRGEESLKKRENVLDTAMNELSSDPEKMKEVAKMLQDPEFLKNMKNMMNDPAVARYMSSMKDMMKDPEMQKKMEAVASGIKSEL